VLLKTKNLVDMHKKLTDTLENMDEGFLWISKNWQIENINVQAAQLVGKNPKEIIMTNFLVTYLIFKDFVYEKYLNAFETLKPDFFEFYIDEKKQWFENRIIPSENGLAIFFKEVTEKKKSEELLKESESNLKSLIENWTESIWAIDENYDYIIFNSFYYEQVKKQYGIDLSKGMNSLEKLENNEMEFWKANYDIALKGKKIAFEIFDENKISKYYEVFLNPIFVDNDVKGVSAFKIDITHSKNREIQLTEAKEKAEKSDKLKTEFLAQVSHEIRTPINNMLNYTGLLVDDSALEKTEENKLLFESIESSSRRIMRTIDLILNLSDIQLGTYESIMKHLDLMHDIIIPVVNEYRSSAEKKNIKLELINNGNKFIINGDSYSLVQIVSNLIDNAIKYTLKGDVKVSVEENEANEIILTISDTGIGISEEFLPNLFEPFRQEEQGYTRSYEGNGIGLALVKKYCEINKINIQLKSKKSVGTTFSLYFEKIK
jgi:signal transduction histidine kinase